MSATATRTTCKVTMDGVEYTGKTYAEAMNKAKAKIREVERRAAQEKSAAENATSDAREGGFLVYAAHFAGKKLEAFPAGKRENELWVKKGRCYFMGQRGYIGEFDLGEGMKVIGGVRSEYGFNAIFLLDKAEGADGDVTALCVGADLVRKGETEDDDDVITTIYEDIPGIGADVLDLSKTPYVPPSEDDDDDDDADDE